MLGDNESILEDSRDVNPKTERRSKQNSFMAVTKVYLENLLLGLVLCFCFLSHCNNSLRT